MEVADGKGSTPIAPLTTHASHKAIQRLQPAPGRVVNSNDFATAVLTCRSLQMQTNLTPDQRAAVDGQLAAVNDRLSAAAEKGDPKALQAAEEIRRRWRTR